MLRCFVFFAVTGTLFSQTPEMIDSVLEEDPLTVGLAVELLEIIACPPCDIVAAQGEDSILLTTGGAASLMVEYLDLQYGFLYRITGAERYAIRELTYCGILPAGAVRTDPVSGETFLKLLTTATEWRKHYVPESEFQ